ncbi:Membrane-bound lytic murein transglycosylase D [hydrothermal vent metagenome]|uniref:Membrane-bound lytic murein transglycosylase D n=1 Tax=hydrothermal vent metagenome TaxID=652676 RepID=A0A3B0ZY72_9ZZZZ
MKQFTLALIFLSLLPGCALLEPSSSSTSKRAYGKHRTSMVSAPKESTQTAQLAADVSSEKTSLDANNETIATTSSPSPELDEKQTAPELNSDVTDAANAAKVVNSELKLEPATESVSKLNNESSVAVVSQTELTTNIPASNNITDDVDDFFYEDSKNDSVTVTNSTTPINDNAKIENALIAIATPADDLFDEEEIDEPFPNVNMDLWERIRNGFSMEERQHKRIDQQLKWFARHQEYMDRVAERAQPYMHYIVEQLEANNIPLEIALLPIVESAFKPFAYSHGRASGIWQFIPATGKRYGLKQNWWYDGRRDVYASTDAAIRLLTALHKEFKGDWMLALAAYNSGGGNVRKAIRYNKKRGRPTGFFHLRLPKETKYYVPKLLALKELIAHPEKYNIELKPIRDEPFLQKVELDSQIDLALAAELAEIPLDELYRLNPGFNRWATSPSGPHHLLVPIANAKTFTANLADFPPEKRIRWIRHTIKKGETISTIARKYQISTNTIKRVNRIRGTRLRAGHGLTIPVASKKLSTYKLSANQRKSKQQNINRKGTKVTHIVQSGDTFWDLAQRHRVGVRQLANWNSMAPRDTLVPGQSLVIWSRNNSSKTDYHDPTHISAPPRRKVTQRIGYRVRSGDSLTRIANKFRVSVNQLLRWNKRVKKSKYLQPGQRIVLYVDVTKTSG